MEKDWVVLRLPENLLIDLRCLAAGAGVTPGQYLRNHIADRAGAAAPEPEQIPLPRPNKSNVGALREMVQDLLFTARDWTGVQAALVNEGFALKPEGYGLVLYTWPSDERICKSAELGFSYSDLIRQLGPGEPPDPTVFNVRTDHSTMPLREAV